MGPQAAAKHLLTGEWIDAEAAVRHGLALEVVPADQLMDRALAAARTIADQPPKALRATVALMRERRRASWDAAVQREYDDMAQLAGGEENIAAITKFFERG
jgi:2-(1,2-epoxy-1,2-dihydrophenyl)acetyl-CoA isomerase